MLDRCFSWQSLLFFYQSIENLLEFFKTIKLSKIANFWGESRQIVDISKLETEKPKKKEKRNLCQTSYHSKKKKQTGSGHKQTNENGKKGKSLRHVHGSMWIVQRTLGPF